MIASFAVGAFPNTRTGITPRAIAPAIGFSAGVCAFFGFYPARKVSPLLPIVALRCE